VPYAPPHPIQHAPHPDGHGHPEDQHGHDHPAHLAHHWDTPVQQFEAGKLGMWLFLATEVLLFGGLFCAYSVWRGNHPELFKYGSTFLNTTLGAVNTAVLILSSLTMAWGVTAAQQNKQGLLKLMLILTLAGAATFLVIKYFEYSHKFHEGWFPGIRFYNVPPEQSHTFKRAIGGEEHSPTTAATQASDGTISPEHAAVMREQAAQAPAHSAPPTAGAAQAPAASSGQGFELETIAITPQSRPADTPPVEAPTFAPAAQGPPGLDSNAALEADAFQMEARHGEAHIHPLQDPNRPANAHMFFNIYFMMTGLHGVHVLVGMIVITWLLINTFRGRFSAEYFTPIDLGGLYWHIVDLIWIFLFPLFYLI
jgi:cytochrome c oxidase subunit 3